MYEEAVTWCNDGLAVSFYLQKQIGHSGFHIDISFDLFDFSLGHFIRF